MFFACVRRLKWDSDAIRGVDEAFKILNKQNNTNHKPVFYSGTKCLRKKICCLIKKYGCKNVAAIIYGSSDEALEIMPNIPTCIDAHGASATATYMSDFTNYKSPQRSGKSITTRDTTQFDISFDYIATDNFSNSDYNKDAVGTSSSFDVADQVIGILGGFDLAKDHAVIFVGQSDHYVSELNNINFFADDAFTERVVGWWQNDRWTVTPDKDIYKIQNNDKNITTTINKSSWYVTGYDIDPNGNLLLSDTQTQYVNWTENTLANL